MSNEAVALTGFISLFALMLLRVPVGMAMGLVGITGFGYLTGFAPALKLVGQTTMRTVTDYSFGVIPMFLLMGAFVSVSGISRELFRAANTFVGHWKGGLGIATIAACGGFAAISGSSVATAATFSAVAYPEMRRFGYPQSFATGVIAVGGTLGAMLPPSTVLAVYGIITQQDIGKLFIAGIVPGLLAIMMHMITIGIIGVARPGFLPAGPRASWRDRLAALRDVWSPLLLFLFVIGGLYGGFFIPTEAGAVGAVGAFIIGILRGKLTRDGILQSLLQATRTAAAVFTVLIGALVLRLFPHHHPDAAERDRVPDRPRHRPLWRAGADPLDVSGAGLPDGCDGDGDPDGADRVSGSDGARLRSDLVRHRHRHDRRTRADSSAGRHERVRHQERDQGRQHVHDLRRRIAVRGDRPDPAGDPDSVSAACDLAAATNDWITPWLYRRLATKYVFTITARIGGVTSAGDIGHGVRRIIPVTRRRGPRREGQRQGLPVRRRLSDHPAQ